MTVDSYRAFLEAKIPTAQRVGFDCELDEVRSHLTDGREMRPHVRAIVRWGVQGGRRAYFLAFGLHKTMIQLETVRIIAAKAGGAGLIVLPLGVRQEFFADAELLGTKVAFCQTNAEIDRLADRVHWPADQQPIILTNYESVREGKIDVSRFVVASLDEADVLRSFGSKTYQEFLPLFDAVPYRFVATATPNPNRHKELIHYAGFLGIMDTGQALTRFFQRNSEKAGDLTLYEHKADEFWLWLNSWACCANRPSDLGFSDDGYVLPALTVRWHVVNSELAPNEAGAGQGKLMRDTAGGVVDFAREKRRSLGARVAKYAEIVGASPADHFLLWHDLEDERRALSVAIPESEFVYGTQKLEDREGIVERFKSGLLRNLGAKAVMLGAGGNLQRHCHRAIFPVGYKFRDFIQAVHRIQRFGQPLPVEIDIVHSELEEPAARDLREKWAQHDEQAARMSEIIRRFGLQHDVALSSLKRSIGVERRIASGEGWTIAHNDCVDEASRMDENSVDLIVTSIPFSNHYEYTPSYNDFGHTDDDRHFFEQMDHLTPALLRALKPGRLACIHVKDRILFGSVTGDGVPTVNPFHAKALFHYLDHGFQFLGMRHVDTDVVRENNQTYRLSYSEMLKDATKMGCGSPEYILLLRKPQSDLTKGYADERVAKMGPRVVLGDGRTFDWDDPDYEEAASGGLGPVAERQVGYSLARWQVDAHAHWRSSGNRILTPEELIATSLADHVERFASMPIGALVKAFREQSRHILYDYEAHVAIGEKIEERAKGDARGRLPRKFMALAPGSSHPDIWDDVVRMRTLNAEQTRAGAEKHVCPLQFDIVDRLIDFYSMPGELVFDPFGGLGTVPLRALKLGRRGYASELNPLYFDFACQFLRDAERGVSAISMLDLLGIAA